MQVSFTWKPAIGSSFLPSEWHAEAHPGYKDITHRKDKVPVFSAIVTGSGGVFLSARLRSHQFVIYLDNSRERLSKKIRTEAFIDSPDLVSIYNCCLQYAAGEWRGSAAYEFTSI